MKKLTAILLFFLIVSCAKNQNFVNQTKIDLPEWVINPQSVSGLGAVGIATKSKAGIKAQIAMAELNAKGNLAAIIQSEISRITKNALRSAKINENDDVEEFFAQATKEVVEDLPLSGVQRDKFFWSKDDETLYIHVTLNPAVYDEFLIKSEKLFANRLKKSQLGRDNINKSEVATKAIFDELEKERNVSK